MRFRNWFGHLVYASSSWWCLTWQASPGHWRYTFIEKAFEVLFKGKRCSTIYLQATRGFWLGVCMVSGDLKLDSLVFFQTDKMMKKKKIRWQLRRSNCFWYSTLVCRLQENAFLAFSKVPRIWYVFIAAPELMFWADQSQSPMSQCCQVCFSFFECPP